MATVDNIAGIDLVYIPDRYTRSVLNRGIESYHGEEFIACKNAVAAQDLANGINSLEEVLEKGQNPDQVLQALRDNLHTFVRIDN